MTTPTGKSALTLPVGYADWLAQLKGQITQARQRASLAVNAELVQLYGRIGRDILERQQSEGWGAKVIDRLALDLKDAFADMRGWSTRNLKYMAFFAQHCPDGLFGQQPAAQLPWFHSEIENGLIRHITRFLLELGAGFAFVGGRFGWRWRSTRCRVSINPSAWPNTNCCVICRPCWNKACPALPTLRLNWPVIWQTRIQMPPWHEAINSYYYAFDSCLRTFPNGYRLI